MRVLRTAGGFAALLALLLAAGCAAYFAYFKTPEIPTTAPAAATRTALAKRAFLFIIDGFAAEPAVPDGLMPTFARLAREGASGVARTSSMSLTAPCVFSLGTGRPGTLLLGMQDFHAPPVHVESLPSLVVAAGKRIALAGDPSWNRQFGWLTVAGDAHTHPEPGVTLDPRVRVADEGSVDFLIPKLHDPAYGLLAVHVGTADAVGHVVTPFGEEYRDALAFIDRLIEKVVRASDGETVVLITGDHGMGPRGTHGGRDDAATLTPFVLWGPGIRPGATGNVAQTALPITLAALLGLPMPVGENPPATQLLAIDDATKRALGDAFLERKTAAARALDPGLASTAAGDPTAWNARLNETLFGSADRRIGWRAATAALFVVSAIAALVFARPAAAALSVRSALAPTILGALVVPAGFAAAAILLITWRSALPLQPDILAGWAAVLLGVAMLGGAVALHRSPELRARVMRSELALYFGTALLLVTPLLTSGWGSPDEYFHALALTLVTVGFVLTSRASGLPIARSPVWISVALLSAGYLGKRYSSMVPGEWLFLGPALALILALAIRNLGGSGPTRRAAATAILITSTAAVLWWKLSGNVAAAEAVLAAFVTGAVCAVAFRTDAMAAASLIIVVSTALGVTMASDEREAFVFVATALAALIATRQQISFADPRAVYFVAIAALTLRVSLYFGLGDLYAVSSIRTAAGFHLVDSGLALPWVVTMLLLKYTIPWLLILAALLPSLVAGGSAVTQLAIRLLAVGYVGRFVAVAAVADPFRVLPHGMEGLVGVFAISWAELVTLAAAGTFVVAMAPAEAATADRHLVADR